MSGGHPANRDLAERLEAIAELLEAQEASPFRVAAYRRAAGTVRALERPVSEVFEHEGLDGLVDLPAIGRSIAALVQEYVRSGRVTLLERLRGAVSPEKVLASVPGIGPVLAHRIHDELGIDTLEELEAACADRRLEGVDGFGPRRLEAIEASLAARLGRRRRPGDRHRPSVAVLLDVDAEYRRRAQRDELPRVAPRRFNPEGHAWLPILHTRREGWELTALFSNTARAHRLGKTDDWVVIYADRDGEHDQCTVVTEGSGRARHRTIRGRELEVAQQHDTSASDASPPDPSTR